MESEGAPVEPGETPVEPREADVESGVAPVEPGEAPVEPRGAPIAHFIVFTYIRMISCARCLCSVFCAASVHYTTLSVCIVGS